MTAPTPSSILETNDKKHTTVGDLEAGTYFRLSDDGTIYMVADVPKRMDIKLSKEDVLIVCAHVPDSYATFQPLAVCTARKDDEAEVVDVEEINVTVTENE